ncbi:unnamed protein product [Moneuplotes crassus]|uniref:Uncharacterized protein n=1 Tax=Euplotes crassus TaxID=5936 RepID=A0AAD1XK75_EUPCR|nr:unnamed protein product [Moneuplotes crassus]
MSKSSQTLLTKETILTGRLLASMILKFRDKRSVVRISKTKSVLKEYSMKGTNFNLKMYQLKKICKIAKNLDIKRLVLKFPLKGPCYQKIFSRFLESSSIRSIQDLACNRTHSIIGFIDDKFHYFVNLMSKVRGTIRLKNLIIKRKQLEAILASLSSCTKIEFTNCELGVDASSSERIRVSGYVSSPLRTIKFTYCTNLNTRLCLSKDDFKVLLSGLVKRNYNGPSQSQSEQAITLCYKDLNKVKIVECGITREKGKDLYEELNSPFLTISGVYFQQKWKFCEKSSCFFI